MSKGCTDWHPIWYTPADSSGNGHRLNIIRPTMPQGHVGGGGGLGGHTFKCLGKLSNGWTDWHHIWYKYADSSGNQHRLNTIRPSISQVFFRGSQIHKYVKAIKRLDRLAPNVAHMCRFIWEWIYAKQIAFRDTRYAPGGFRGSNIQKS